MKIFFISLFSIILSFFTPLNSNLSEKDIFDSNCKQGYTSYHTLHIEKTEQYYLEIIEGDINKAVAYSIYFSSSMPNEYNLMLQKGNSNSYLSFEKDSRGDVKLYNLQLDNNLVVEIKTKGITTYSYEIEVKSIEEYSTLTAIKIGEGLGLASSKVEGMLKDNLIYLLSIIFTIIIILSIIIILILYVTKKGFFNKDIIDKEFEEQHKVRDDIHSFIKEQSNIVEVTAEEVEIKEEESKEVYTKVKDYDTEVQRDISLLLKQKGYNTNYNALLTHEKNEVMLELMRMKDFKEITEEEYKEEIIKLWM